jgi:hypothetical protein
MADNTETTPETQPETTPEGNIFHSYAEDIVSFIDLLRLILSSLIPFNLSLHLTNDINRMVL